MKVLFFILIFAFTAQIQAESSQECFIMPREFKARHAVLLELESIKAELENERALEAKTIREIPDRIQELINIIVEDKTLKVFGDELIFNKPL